MNIPVRPRRLRSSAAVRGFAQETTLSVANLVYPMFVREGAGITEVIPSMPGIYRYSVDTLLAELEEVVALAIPAVALFPLVPEEQKTRDAAEAYNPEGLIPRAVRAIKERFPDLLVLTDVALDPYNSDGHDGLVSDAGEIVNDATVKVLCKMALCQAEAGADFVCPSDMMDGRIGAIRACLDGAGFERTGIMAYSAKYASAFYGPFRDALDSAPKTDNSCVPGDKKTYQMDPANATEALREVSLDIAEGADFVMVKPALPYLDVVARVATMSRVPVAAYQVSGEYAMLCAAFQNGWLDRGSCIHESLLSIRRAGATMIWTYFAKEWARTTHT